MLPENPHRRLNLLNGEWVLVSPHRTKRPWQGQTEATAAQNEPEYDSECYLCPGNRRAGNEMNPEYVSTFFFDNDFAALYPNFSPGNYNRENLLVAQGERGICRVICFSPKHNLTLAKMSKAEIVPIIELWTLQFKELSAVDFINSVLIFENRGAMMGASNPHPHGQIWASESVPNELAKEVSSFEKYLGENGKCLLCEYLKIELETKERIVFENGNFVVLVPFWAIYPFETMLLPKRHLSGMDELTADEQADLADALQRVTVRYDNVFKTAFPYSMGFHQRPTDERDNSFFHLHAHFYPPLLRSATIRKFLVGFEILGSPQRDITPESAAERLREMSETHYLNA